MTLIGGTFEHKGTPYVTVTPRTNKYGRHADPKRGERIQVGFCMDSIATTITDKTPVTIIVRTLNTNGDVEGAYSENSTVAYLRSHFKALGQPLTDDGTWQQILSLYRTTELSANLEKYHATPPKGFISVKCLTEPPAEDVALHFIKITDHKRSVQVQREIRYIDRRRGCMVTTKKDTISWAHFVQNYANDKGEPLSTGDNAALFLRMYFDIYPPVPDDYEPPAL